MAFSKFLEPPKGSLMRVLYSATCHAWSAMTRAHEAGDIIEAEKQRKIACDRVELYTQLGKIAPTEWYETNDKLHSADPSVNVRYDQLKEIG